ncbi:MAG: hypothetical protein EXS63_08820, partial [Candidatus Omnitrophica bacterium]|nr:hypothetical protein [Candidatus Omnitrophota bacterium]
MTSVSLPQASAEISLVPTAGYRSLADDLTAIALPKEIGKIQEIYRGTSDKIVILIQDAHSIPDAQRSIRSAIDHFQTQYGISTVGLEGASEKLDPQIFRSFPDKELLRKTFDAYAGRGELTGGTAAALFNTLPSSYQGIEDWPLYEEGVSYFLKATGMEPEIKARLDPMVAALNREKETVYSKELLEIDHLLANFGENKTDLVQVLNQLNKYQPPIKGSELAILLDEIQRNQTTDTPSEIEIKKIAEQVAAVLKSRPLSSEVRQELQEFNGQFQEFQTSRLTPQAFALHLKGLMKKHKIRIKVSHSLASLVENQKRLKDIEGTRLFEEFKRYADSVKGSLLQNEQQKILDVQTQGLELMQRLTRLELSFEDWEKVQKMLLQLDPWTLTPQDGVISRDQISALLKKMEPHLEFYRVAEKRDQIFLKNIQSMMEKQDKSSSILVAGGFHTEGLTQTFKAKGISYILVMPWIGAIPEEPLYREHMQGQVSWSDYFEVKDGKVNLYDAFVRATRDKLVHRPWSIDQSKKQSRSDHGPSTMDYGLAKHWRDQIIRDLAAEGRITQASEYTRFIDETTQPSSPNNQSLREKWLANIDRFGEGLKKLQTEGNLSESSIVQLIKTITTAELSLNVLSPNARAEARLIPSIKILVKNRSEMRNQQLEFQAQAPGERDILENAIAMNRARLTTAIQGFRELSGNPVLSNNRPIHPLSQGNLQTFCDAAMFDLKQRLASLETEGVLSIRTYDSNNLYEEGVINVLSHAFLVVEFSSGNRYLIDTTFIQFFEANRKSINDARGWEVERNGWLPLAVELLKNGYIKITDDVAKMHSVALGKPPAKASQYTARLYERPSTYNATLEQNPFLQRAFEALLPENLITAELLSTIPKLVARAMAISGINESNLKVQAANIPSANTRVKVGLLSSIQGVETHPSTSSGKVRSESRATPPTGTASGSTRTKIGFNEGEIFNEAGMDRALVTGEGLISQTEKFIVYGDKTYVVWYAGPKKGRIYLVLEKPSSESLKSVSSLAQILDHIDSTLKKMDERGHQPLFDGELIELLVYLHQLYNGGQERLGLKDVRYYDPAINEFVQALQKKGLKLWLLARAREKGYKNVSIMEGALIEQNELNRYYYGVVPTRNNTYFNAKDPVVLIHATYDSILTDIVNEGALVSNDARDKEIKKKTGEGQGSYDGHVVSFWSFPDGNVEIEGSQGSDRGLGRPIVFGISRSKTRALEQLTETIDVRGHVIQVKKIMDGTVSGEKTVYGRVSLEDIGYAFVPYFAVEDVKKILTAHGFGHIEVLPLGFNNNEPVWTPIPPARSEMRMVDERSGTNAKGLEATPPSGTASGSTLAKVGLLPPIQHSERSNRTENGQQVRSEMRTQSFGAYGIFDQNTNEFSLHPIDSVARQALENDLGPVAEVLIDENGEIHSKGRGWEVPFQYHAFVKQLRRWIPENQTVKLALHLNGMSKAQYEDQKNEYGAFDLFLPEHKSVQGRVISFRDSQDYVHLPFAALDSEQSIASVLAVQAFLAALGEQPGRKSKLMDHTMHELIKGPLFAFSGTDIFHQPDGGTQWKPLLSLWDKFRHLGMKDLKKVSTKEIELERRILMLEIDKLDSDSQDAFLNRYMGQWFPPAVAQNIRLAFSKGPVVEELGDID